MAGRNKVLACMFLCLLCGLLGGADHMVAWAEPVAIAISIKDPNFQRSDPRNSAWKGVSHSDAFQGSYYHDSARNSPELYGTWIPSITSPGRYNVYMRWVAHPNRSAAARVQIKHRNGVAETTVDQRVDGGNWNLLGQYEFTAGDEGYVRLFSSPGYTVYDAVKFELIGAPEPPDGIDLNANQTTGTESTWLIPDVLLAGEYEVYVHQTAASDNVPKEAAVHIKFDLGLDTSQTIDQTMSEWTNIGRYHFTPQYGQYVKLIGHQGAVIAAQTIRLVLVKQYSSSVNARIPAFTALPLSQPRHSGPVQVSIVKDVLGNYSLVRDGQPYFIKGVCGSEDLSVVASSGANAVRTYSHRALNGYAALDEAYEKGIGVFIGLWLTQQGSGIDYSNPFYRNKIAEQLDELKELVVRYKDHPAVIGWALGNEVDKGNPDVWYHINELAKFVHEVDPNHPTMAVLAGAHPSRVEQIRSRAPYIDIIGVNSYTHIGEVYHNIVDLGGWTGPYMLTEWGPDAAYEVAKANGIAPIEQPSHYKAMTYFQRYQEHVVGSAVSSRLVGSFVFKLADVFGSTHTWYNILLEDSKKTPLMDEMIRSWTGAYPQNQAPRVWQLALTSGNYHSLTLGQESEATVLLSPGERFLLHAKVTDNEDDPLEYRWEIRHEFKSGVTSAPPGVVPGVVMEAADAASAMYFYAPKTPGDYRVYFYVYDGNHNVGTHNFPFRVE